MLFDEHFLYEVLVPTVRPNTYGKKFFTTRFHRTWDAKVLAITNGLTVLTPSKGQWVSPSGTLFRERMIPVRISATEGQMSKICMMTLDHYEQEALFVAKLGHVAIIHHPTRRNRS